jgi:hypothetical protein
MKSAGIEFSAVPKTNTKLLRYRSGHESAYIEIARM